ncbi:hypothetical protein [Magnetospira sp. QH-2]|uniref:hypothetical protein n=1 Tax=Magnetospira sp. (strain QH-2) TaxID=1288970 RepID=UPI0003E81174|nr:hypothetical protein [Magnetospira sp. QH-2]CCQ72423.1 protein of unknown function [Magnetospira sp. QH-2]
MSRQNESYHRRKAGIQMLRVPVSLDLVDSLIDSGLLDGETMIPDWRMLRKEEVQKAVVQALRDWADKRDSI